MTTRLRSEGWARYWMQWSVPLALGVLAFAARAQAVPEPSLGAALESLASRASVAFAGEVISVRPEAGVVEVQFRVDQVLLGSPGTTFTLREWAGLWSAGRRRFFAGEHAAVFLHAAAGGGLASPVDGMDGVLPTIPTGVGGAVLVDVRRLQTRVLRPMGAALDSEGGGAIRLTDLATLVAGGSRPGSHDPLRVALPLGYEAPAAQPVQTQLVPLPNGAPLASGAQASRAGVGPARCEPGAGQPFSVAVQTGQPR